MHSPRLTELRRVAGLILCAALGLSQAGCLVVPYPMHHKGGPNPNFRSSLDEGSKLIEGTTTRRDVLLALGEPDGRGYDDRWFAYKAVEGRAGLHWGYTVGTIGGGGGDGAIDDLDTAQRLVIRFDERGVVSQILFKKTNCTEQYLDTHDCPSARGDDLLKLDEEYLVGRYGAVSARLDTWSLVVDPHCEFHSTHRVSSNGQPFLVTEKGLLWIEWGNQWRTVDFAQVQSIRPLETHQGLYYVPIAMRDGSCLFLFDLAFRKRADALRESLSAAIEAVNATPP
jgi:hypothetical protein